MGYFSQVASDIAEAEHQLNYENSIQYSVSMSLQSLTGSVTELCKVASEGPRGYAVVQNEREDIALTCSKLQRLLLTLYGRKA